MKPIAFFLAAILYFAQAHAQTYTFSYEWADSLSSSISALERQIEGKVYKDAGGISTLSFPGENFKVYFHDKLGAKAFYMASSDREILILTENIDFSKVTGMSISEDPNNVSYIQLHFPAGHLKVQFIENGVVIQTSTDINALEFYCRYGTVDDTRKMVDLLYGLCLGLKVEKGELTAQQAKQQQGMWKEAVAKNTPAAYYDFVQKFPNTIVQEIAYYNSEKIDSTIKYITGSTNGFYLGMAKDEFTKIVQDRVTKTKNSDQKLSKNFKLYLDNFEVQYYGKKPYSTYTIGNWFKTYYTDSDSRNDARDAKGLRIHEFEIERKVESAGIYRSSMKDQVEELNLSWNKSYKLKREVEDYEYTIGQIKDTKIHQTFFPFARYASLGDIVFENDIAKEITYTFVIYDNYMSYDAALQRTVELMGKPIREKTHTKTLIDSRDGKVVYFDKGRYYVVASVRRDYNSDGWLYTPLQASLTFIVK